MDCDNYKYLNDSTISWISPQVNSKDGVYFAMLFTLWTSGYAFGYDPTSRFQLRPNKPGKPEDLRFCVAEGSK